ncbi:MAG TPA: DinB family protein [Thermomicrobiales bacterium]|nr:DinB family protein [Thermomicrobiales bacterium]
MHAALDASGGPGHPAGFGRDDDSEPTNGVPVVAFEGLRDRENIHRALVAAVGDFERLIAGKSRETLAQPANDGRWGMVEILPHMRDWEKVNHDRIARVLNEENPHLEMPDDSLWAIEHDYAAQDPVRVFEEFKGLRGELVDLVEHLDDDAWSLPATLDGIGEINLHWLLNNVCVHDGHHLQQARDLLV